MRGEAWADRPGGLRSWPGLADSRKPTAKQNLASRVSRACPWSSEVGRGALDGLGEWFFEGAGALLDAGEASARLPAPLGTSNRFANTRDSLRLASTL